MPNEKLWNISVLVTKTLLSSAFMPSLFYLSSIFLISSRSCTQNPALWFIAMVGCIFSVPLDGCSAARQTTLRTRKCVWLPHKGLLEGVIEPGKRWSDGVGGKILILILVAFQPRASIKLWSMFCKVLSWQMFNISAMFDWLHNKQSFFLSRT